MISRYRVSQCSTILALYLLTYSAFADEKFMRNYQRGEPSATLYVKNLAKDVSERDLLAVFGAVVPEDLRFVCRHVSRAFLLLNNSEAYLFSDLLLLTAVRSRSGISRKAG